MDQPVVPPAWSWGGGQAQRQAAIPQCVRSPTSLFFPNSFPRPISRVQISCGLKFFIASFPRNGCLYELLVAGLDRLKLSYKQFFPSPFLQTEQAEMQFTELLTTIGSWPQVCILTFLFTSRFCENSVEFSGREGIRFSIPCAAVLPGHAGLGGEKAGRGLPAQVCHSTPEIPHQQVSRAPFSLKTYCNKIANLINLNV